MSIKTRKRDEVSPIPESYTVISNFTFTPHTLNVIAIFVLIVFRVLVLALASGEEP